MYVRLRIMGVKNVSFSENFVNMTNEWSLHDPKILRINNFFDTQTAGM